jgi:hypothetical protein
MEGKRMSVKSDILYHPVNGSTEQTWSGFSWPAFFFGVIWLLVKGLWGHFLINLIIVIGTGGFAAPVIWIVYGVIGNDAHKSSLIKRGYLTQAQWEAKAVAPATPGAVVSAAAPARDQVLQLRDLADLREKGVLTEQEFAKQKAKILAD